MFEIKNDVAIPEKRNTRNGNTIYPFRQLEVGQMFEVPTNAVDKDGNDVEPATFSHEEQKKKLSSIQSGSHKIKIETYLKDGELKKFVVRKTENGVGVWRVEPTAADIESAKGFKLPTPPTKKVEVKAETKDVPKGKGK